MLFKNGDSSNDCSRFSRWFKRDSPPLQNQQQNQQDQLRSSIQDELLNNLLNDISEPTIKVPSVTESNAYFAPIAPAASSSLSSQQPQPEGTAIKLLEMLQRNNKPSQNGQGEIASGLMSMIKNPPMKEMGK